MKAVAALRNQFGGHAVKKSAGPSGGPGDTAGPSSGTGSTQK
jgi:6-phosphogluconate dehydrogenase